MKGDDMDEILRKAAENYEVDADAAADWESVYAAVHEPDEKAPLSKERKKRFVFWWLFLIPLGWIAHTEYNKFYTGSSQANNNSTTTVKTKPVTSETGTQQSSVATNNSSLNKKEIIEQPVITNTANSLHKQNTFVRNHKPELPNANNNSQTNNVNTHPVASKTNSNSVIDNNIANNSLVPQKQQAQQFIQPTQTADQKSFINSQQQKPSENNVQSTITNNQQNNLPTATQNQNTQSQNITNKTGVKKSSANKEKSNTNYFYTGLMAGADFSFIKYQKTKPIGYNAGLLVGYKFNKLSVESGFFIDKKNYFTKGEYFDKSKLPFFNDAEILTADGYCKMFEIPLNIKYDFSTHKNHTWFATVGASSYLMNKEFYNYAYTKDGQEYYGSRPYYHTTKDFLSVLNLSAGYQLQSGNKMNLRIEPYYKIPLSGMGTANLHITSVGINVGITRRIP